MATSPRTPSTTTSSSASGNPEPGVPGGEGAGHPTRRAVARGALWTVPVAAMAVGAPAVASSRPIPCTPSAGVMQTRPSGYPASTAYYSSDIAVGERNASSNGSVRATSSSTTNLFGFTVSTTVYGDTYLATDSTTDSVRHLSSQYTTGTYSGLINPIPITNETTGTARRAGSAANYPHRQTTTITFTKPVYNLRFAVGDIDSYVGTGTGTAVYSSRYRDNVAIRANYSSGTQVAGGTREPNTNVIGSGTVADPFRRPDPLLSTNLPWDSTQGTVYTNFANGPITSVEVDFWSGEGGGLQVVLLSASFQYCP